MIAHESKKPTVLIIDDDADFVESLSEVLRHRGYIVHSIDDGCALDDVLEKTSVEVILLDLHMPGVNRFNAFFEYVLRQSGGQFEVTSAARDLGITRPTVESHLRALEITHAASVIRPFHGGGQND